MAADQDGGALLELWATVGEAPAYEVSTWGRVRRLLEDGSAIDVASWPNKKGYELVSLEIPGRTLPALRYVHRLVLAAFSRPPAAGEEGNHDDGRKAHNVLDNLAWMTQDANRAHARARGLIPRRRAAPRATCRAGHPFDQVYRQRDREGVLRTWRRCGRCRRAAYRRAVHGGRGALLELAEIASGP